MRRPLLALLALLLVSGCSAGLSNSFVRPDYAQTDQSTVRRLFIRVACQDLPDPKETHGTLWSTLARRFANQKRNFIVRPEAEGLPTACDDKLDSGLALAGNRAAWPESYCGGGLEGVLFMAPAAERLAGSPVRARTALKASLRRCSDGAETWRAEGDGEFRGGDHDLKELLTQGIEEFGPESAPYFAPAFRQIRALFDTLPQPVLDEAAEVEKIELGE